MFRILILAWTLGALVFPTAALADGLSPEEQDFFKTHVAGLVQMIQPPKRVTVPAVEKVFSWPVYEVGFSFQGDTGYTPVFLTKSGDRLVRIPELSGGPHSLPDLLSMLDAKFMLRSDEDGKTIQSALDALYDHSFGWDRIKHSGRQWSYITWANRGEGPGVIFQTDADGRIVSAQYSPLINPDYSTDLKPGGPAESTRRCLQALDRHDDKTFKSFLSRSVNDYLATSPNRQSALKFFEKLVEEQRPPQGATISEEIKGNSAHVRYQGGDMKDAAKTIDLSLEDGTWKLLMLDQKTLVALDASLTAAGLESGRDARDPEVRKGIKALYARRDGAFEARDASAFAATETDDFRAVVWFGVPVLQERATLDAFSAQELSTAKSVAFTRVIQGIRQRSRPDEAVVDSTQSCTIIGQGGERNESTTTCRDICVKTPDGWKISYTEALGFSAHAKTQLKVNGKTP